MTELGNVPAPPTDEELLSALAPTLDLVIKEDVEGDTDAEKTWQYNNARRNYLFFRGMQFIAPTFRNGYADYAPVSGWQSPSAGDNGGDGSYDYTRNITRGYGTKFVAVLGQRAPNVVAVPDDPTDERSSRAARQANQVSAILNSWWDIDQKNIEVAMWMWITGPAYIYTPWNADGLTYGFREEPKYRMETQPMGEPSYRCMGCSASLPAPGICPDCGYEVGPETLQQPEMAEVPVPDGVTQYPNGRVECYVLDCTKVSTPFHCTNDARLWPWLRYEYEENRAFLIQMFPQLRGKPDDWGSSSVSSTQGREVRESIVSPTGSPVRSKSKTRWLFTRIWLHPKEYNLVKDEQRRKVLEENFPDGVKISRVNGETVRLEHERLADVWAAAQPSAAANLNSDPVMQDLVSAQLLTNHTLNIAQQTIEQGNPLTFADPRVINFEHWKNQSSKPNSVIPTLPAVGSSLAESFYQTQPSRFSDQMEPWIQSVEAGAVQDVGTTPQIFGGGNASTAREAEINKNAAMAQLGIHWMYMRKAWERAKRNGVMQLLKYGPSVIQEGKNIANLAEVAEGKWHFEADEAYPANWGQQRDFWMFMSQQPKEVQDAWGMSRPENIAKRQSLMGMDGLYIPGLDDREKTLDTIQKLLQGQPIVQQNPDGSTDIQPSIPADEFEDDPNLVVQLVKGWAQKASLAGGERETNPNGYSNVISWGKAYQQMLNPPPPPPPPVTPKVSVSVSSKDLSPSQTQAILQDANLQVPPPELPPMIPGGPVPPMAPPQTIQ